MIRVKVGKFTWEKNKSRQAFTSLVESSCAEDLKNAFSNFNHFWLKTLQFHQIQFCEPLQQIISEADASSATFVSCLINWPSLRQSTLSQEHWQSTTEMAIIHNKEQGSNFSLTAGGEFKRSAEMEILKSTIYSLGSMKSVRWELSFLCAHSSALREEHAAKTVHERFSLLKLTYDQHFKCFCTHLLLLSSLC